MHVWATRVREQGVIDTHIHEGSWLSGAFYVELPPALDEDDGAGWIEFGQLYPGLPAPPQQHLLRIRPRPGAMLFFPPTCSIAPCPTAATASASAFPSTWGRRGRRSRDQGAG